MKTILDIQKAYKEKHKISMVTCYDHWTAKILKSSAVDLLLVGDSAAMVMHGGDSPVLADVDMMAAHIRSVRLGAPNKFIVGDMPFMSFRKDTVTGLSSAEVLIRAGANAIKLEGVTGHEELIERLVQSGIPVMGHLGLTPQSVNAFGGFKVQGRMKKQAQEIQEQAVLLEKLGCFSIVLECVPSPLAREITESLGVPTIGIGAGPDTSGQVLVLQDLLGADEGFHPKFLKKYANLNKTILEAVNEYHSDVQKGSFPSPGESYE